MQHNCHKNHKILSSSFLFISKFYITEKYIILKLFYRTIELKNKYIFKTLNPNLAKHELNNSNHGDYQKNIYIILK